MRLQIKSRWKTFVNSELVQASRRQVGWVGLKWREEEGKSGERATT